LYDSLTRVPLVIRFPAPLHFPAFAPKTGRSSVIASSVDLLPTTLDFLGLPGDAAMQGRSVLAELDAPAGGSAYLEERLEHYGPYEIFGLREGRFKYIWIERFERNDLPQALLFDLETDPHEQRNLVHERQDLAAEFHARVMQRRRAYEAVALGTGTAEVDARTKALLEKLGYAESDRDEDAVEDP
jgi:arylsulfatase A-like enzyme